MVQKYRALVHYIIQIIKSLQFITESLDFLNSHFMYSKSRESPNQNHFFICEPIIFTEFCTWRRRSKTPHKISVSSLAEGTTDFSERKIRVGTAEPVSWAARQAALTVPNVRHDRQVAASSGTPCPRCRLPGQPQASGAHLSQEEKHP